MDKVQSPDGTTIAYDRSGQGPPVVLALGAFCDRHTGQGLAEHLAPHFTVLAYDRRGRGDSGDTAPYDVQREVEDLAAVIDAAGGTAFVFGHSSGAILALRAASQHVAIFRLAAYEPPFIVGHDRPRSGDLTERVNRFVAAGQLSEAMEAFMLEGPQMPREVVEGMKGSPAWGALQAVAHTLPYDLAVCGDQVVPDDELAQIEVPTLMLSGGDSPAWATHAVDAVAAATPGARQQSLAGQTHGAADEVLAPVLVEFFGG